MARADRAEVVWGDREHKKGWVIRIQIGAEVIKRPPPKGVGHDADEAAVRAMAVEAARNDGYELDPGAVAIRR